jgi:hypothetical protein
VKWMNLSLNFKSKVSLRDKSKGYWFR